MHILAIIGSVALLASPLAAQQNQAWHYRKDDPTTKKHVIQIDAASFESSAGAETIKLHDMTVRIYNASSSFTQLKSKDAVINEKLGTLTYGPQLKTVLKLKNRA
jgi:hypothetical protein